MENGFIYYIANYIIEGLEYFNIVRFFKFIASKLNPSPNDIDKKLMFSRVAVDVFIILKFFLIILLWSFEVDNLIVTIFVWYLILMNLQTYFYYHIWCEDAVTSAHAYLHRLRRRFVTLFLAIVFSNISFAYLYACVYNCGFTWGDNGYYVLQALWFSTSNSFAANYSVVTPVDAVANSVCMIQLIITFIFVTIILSKSIPQTPTS